MIFVISTQVLLNNDALHMLCITMYLKFVSVVLVIVLILIAYVASFCIMFVRDKNSTDDDDDDDDDDDADDDDNPIYCSFFRLFVCLFS